MSSPRRKVPSFSLYGEHIAASAQTDALHIESIQSRSRKYLWKIETHRHIMLSQVVVVCGGPAAVFLDDRRYDFAGRAAIIIPAGTIHSFQFSPETHGRVLTVNLEYLLSAAGQAHEMPIQSLFAVARAVDLDAEQTLFERLSQMLLALESEFKQPNSVSMPVCTWLACCALSVLSHEMVDDRTVESRGAAGADYLRRFRALIEEQFLHHWPTQRFAQELGLSETSLNRLCRRLAGTTAFDLIQQRVALEARRKLMYSTNSVCAIAIELGFKDAAYFCRFFRRHCGASPNDFRRGHARLLRPVP
jgi:AraC family transcriptional regulator, transcriptional activator of pobA